MKKLLTICLMLLGAVAQAQNFAITATTEAAIRKNIVKGNAANYGFGMINDTLKLVGLTTRNVIFTGSTSKTGIGLGNVDNTSDLNKPVSTATQTALNLKQNQLNGTGFVKATGTTISYDNSTYLSTSTAVSTYLPISNPTATGTLTAPTIANSLGATFATSSGNVGIGTNAPATNLHVNRATTSAFPLIRLETTGAGGRPYMDFKAENVDYGYMGWGGTSNNNMFIQNYLNADLQFGTNSATRMTIKGGGNVLIGTTTDLGYKLNVVGGVSNFSDNILLSGGVGANNKIGFNADAVNYYIQGISSGMQYSPYSVGNFTFTSGAGNWSFTNGNVGIGTTAPNAKLDVNGTARVAGDLSMTGTYPILTLFGSQSGSLNIRLQNYITGVSNTGFEIYDQTNTASRLAITGTGNIGIGTTSPQNLLHIKGTASMGVGVRNSHLIIESAETAAVGVGAVLKFAGQSGNAVNPYSFGTIEARKESAVANNYSSYMTFQTIESNGGSTERMRISGNGNIGIGTDAPLASSILDIASTTKGVLFPRLTTTQISAIASPADGLTVYNTTLKAICFYDAGAAVWKRVSHSNM